MTLTLLKRLCTDTRQLDVGEEVAVLSASQIDPVQFLRCYVGPNKPVLVKGALQHAGTCRALDCWTPEYLVEKAGSTIVSVDFTPNGLGDAAVTCCASGQECFCIPYKQQISFQQFVNTFFGNKEELTESSSWIPYLQQQNSNLTEELPDLLPDVGGSPSFAAGAFGAAPEAVNLWIGDDRSTTSFHKDHYENLYGVITGRKIFHLLPPSDAFRMGLRLYPAAQFQPEGSQLVPVLQQSPGSSVMWCPIHPEPEDPSAAKAAHPLFFDDDLPRPLLVEVAAGDVLYLPAMWWHYVQQEAGQQGWCVAVNWWYDMQFDVRYAHYKLAESLAVGLGLIPVMPGSEDGVDEAPAEQLSYDQHGQEVLMSMKGYQRYVGKKTE